MTFESTSKPIDKGAPVAGRETVALVVVAPTEGHLTEDSKAAVRSVLTQSVVPEAVLVVNVGADALLQWADQDLGATTLKQVHVPDATTLGQAVDAVLGEDADAQNASWIWIVHDDMIAQPDALEKMLELGRASNAIGAIGPKQVNYEDPTKILEVGIAATRSARRVDQVEPDEIDQGQYDHLEDVLAVGTAGMLMRRAAWENVGGFDPVLGPFGDGLEFGRRLWRAGFRVVAAPTALVRHRQRAFDHESAGRSSFGRRRGAQIYNWVLAVPTAWLFPLLLWLPIWSALRSVGRLLSRQPRLAVAELAAYFGLVSRSANIRSQRRRIREVARVPRSALRALEQTPRTLSQVRRHQRRIRTGGRGEAKPLDAGALDALRRHQYKSGAALAVLVLAAAILSIFLWSPYTEGIQRGRWGVLPDSWTTLVAQAWGGWQLSGDGAAGPAPATLLPMSLFSAPFALVGIPPSTFQFILLYASTPLAIVGGWLTAGLFTRSVMTRTALAVIWAASGALWLPMSSGDMALVLAYVALPFLFVGMWRGYRKPLQLRAESVRDVTVTARPDRFAWLGLAGLALLAVAPASPVMIKVAAVVAILLAWLPTSRLFEDLEGAPTPDHERGLRFSAATFESLGAKLAGFAVILLPALIWMGPALGTRALRLAQRAAGPGEYSLAQMWSWALGGTVGDGPPTWWQFLAGYPANPSVYGPQTSTDSASWWMILVLLGGLGLLLWATCALVYSSIRSVPANSDARRNTIRTIAFFLSAIILWALALTGGQGGSEVGGGPSGYPVILMAAGSLALLGAVAASMEKVRLPARALRRDFPTQRRARVRAVAGAVGLVLGTVSLAVFSILGATGPLSPRMMERNSAQNSEGAAQHLEPQDLTIAPGPAGGFPLTASEAQNGPRAARVLTISVHDDVVQSHLLRGPGLQMADVGAGAPNTDLVNFEAVRLAEDNLATGIADLVSGIQGEAAGTLSQHAVDMVLLEAGTENSAELANRLDSTDGLERIGSVDIGTMWRVRPGEQLPARLKLSDLGELDMPVDSGPLSTTQEITVDHDALLVLAETADPHWVAHFDGQRLETSQNPGDWRQIWEIPAGEGTLSVRFEPRYLPWWQWASGIALVLLVSSAIPWRYRRPTRVQVEGGGDD